MAETASELWVFAYGSLMWKPGFDYAERRRARVPGYVRRFCLDSITYRGTPDILRGANECDTWGPFESFELNCDWDFEDEGEARAKLGVLRIEMNACLSDPLTDQGVGNRSNNFTYLKRFRTRVGDEDREEEFSISLKFYRYDGSIPASYTVGLSIER